MALKVAGVIFLFVSVMHLFRFIFKVDVVVGGFVVPLWFSLCGFVFALVISLWMFKSSWCVR